MLAVVVVGVHIIAVLLAIASTFAVLVPVIVLLFTVGILNMATTVLPVASIM